MNVSMSDGPARVAPADLEPRRPAPVAAVRGPSFAQVLHGVGQELDRGERGIHAAIGAMSGGSDLPPGQLIALQVSAYRYSNVVDLASRLVDRATGSVKTVLQGSGQ